MSDRSFKWARVAGWATAASALFAAALVAGCGGGGSAGTDSAAAYTAGPVSGYGSIIVNGVRFDDSAARVEDDEGNSGTAAVLKLGMMVEIDSGAVDDSVARAVARHIRFGSELIGPVASVDTATNTFVVLGQTVEVRSNTHFEDSLAAGGVAGLAGRTVEVHALFDAATGHYIATRIEDRLAVVLFKIRGLVSHLDTGAKTFQIGDALISYANVPDAQLPPALADGLRVRVRLETAQVAGKWVAVTVRSGVRKIDDLPDARLRGTVTTFNSATSFEVSGIPVDASGAVIDRGPVTLGARVEVRGHAKDGTIVATRVKVLRDDDDEIRGIELHGTASEVDTTANTFTLRGVKVGYGTLVFWVRGNEAQLVDGAKVEVRGILDVDGNTLTAVVIKFED